MRPCNVFRDVQASDQEGPGGNIGFGLGGTQAWRTSRPASFATKTAEPGGSSAGPCVKSAVAPSTDRAYQFRLQQEVWVLVEAAHERATIDDVSSRR